MLSRRLRRTAVACRDRVASVYIAGPALSDALARARDVAEDGLGCSIACWDRAGTPAEVVARTVRDDARAIASSGLDAVIVVKAPPIGFDARALEAIVTAAPGSRIVLDAHRERDATQTYDLLGAVAAPGRDLGCALPARWPRSAADAECAVEAGWAVRLVKGQFRAAAAEPDHAAAMLRLASRLAGRARRVGVATHDPALARGCLRMLVDAGTPCELELLHGLPMRRPLEVARALGVPVRVYVPYGEPGLPYAVAHIRRRPRAALWLMRDAARALSRV